MELGLFLSPNCGSGFQRGDWLPHWLGRTSPNSEAAATAEMFAMHRMIRNLVNRLTTQFTWSETHGDSDQQRTSKSIGVGYAPLRRSMGLALALLASSQLCGTSSAQNVALANYDLAGSGFVAPAGMPPLGSPQMMGMVTQVGYNGCDGGGYGPAGCDAIGMQPCMDRMVCGTCGGGGGCDCNGMFGGGGLLGKLRNGHCSGCNGCGEMPFGYMGACLAGAFDLIRPYEDASICNQRWYDLSLEGSFLEREFGSGAPSIITTQGVSGTPVLTSDDAGEDDFAEGVRFSAAFIWGPGGNVELTYMGGNEWTGTGSAVSSTPTLYSFVSDYGNNPNNGLDDTDRSLSQSLVARSDFHSAEINYRRRTMFPYCRFQSSWLVGLRYVRYDDSLMYSTNGDAGRFFTSDSESKNSLFGPQAGFDFWWNTYPGVSIGFGSKGAWVQNDVDRSTNLSANSLGPGATPGSVSSNDGDQDATVVADFELKAVYRFSHSLSLRGSYYVLWVDDISYGGIDAANVQNIIQTGSLDRSFAYDDLTLTGFTIGAEYMW